MITREVPNRLYTILNSSVNNPLEDWLTVGKGNIQIVVDDILQKKVVSLEHGENPCVCLIKEFKPEDLSPAPRLTCLCLLVRTLPRQPFTCDIEMSVQSCEEPKEMSTKTFTLTTDKRKTTNQQARQDPMEAGWNYIVFRLAEMCSTFYRGRYVRTSKIQLYGRCKLYRAYFCDRFYYNEELPEGYRLAPYDSCDVYTAAEESTC